MVATASGRVSATSAAASSVTNGRTPRARSRSIERFRAIVANGDLVNRFVRARHRDYRVYGPELERLIPKSIWNEKRHIADLCWGTFVTAISAAVGSKITSSLVGNVAARS